jgi:SAM-dependent methyltransferase
MIGIGEQQRFYDERWGSFVFPGHLELERASTLIDLMRYVKSYDRICDLGCGSGWISGVLGHFGRTLGVDLSDVARARARFPNCEFLSENILDWQHPKAMFDLLISSEVIEHIPYNVQSNYTKICYDLLKPGGSLILTTPNKKTMDAIPGGGRTWSDQPIEDWLDRQSLFSLLERTGFRIRRKTSITLGIGNMGIHRVVNSVKLSRFLARFGLVDMWRALALSLDFGLHLAVLAEKPGD